MANNNSMHAVKYKINILSYFRSHKILQSIVTVKWKSLSQIHRKFLLESDSEGILEIGFHLSKLWLKIKGVFISGTRCKHIFTMYINASHLASVQAVWSKKERQRHIVYAAAAAAAVIRGLSWENNISGERWAKMFVAPVVSVMRRTSTWRNCN